MVVAEQTQTHQTAPLTTIEELLKLPGDVRCELIEGNLVEMSPTQAAHVVVTSRLVTGLVLYFATHAGSGALWVGEGGYIVQRNPDTVLVPDLAIVSSEQVAGHTAATRGFLSFVPMIVVEVKSPSDREAKIAERLGLFLEGGAQEVWWVRPDEKSITIHRPDGPFDLLREADTLASELLPGFALPVTDLFA